jgi:dipeptidyl aminopeptidase/acylaminoacyl peptidase
MGYNILAINFAGSGGFGVDYLESSIRAIGETDVAEIWRAIELAGSFAGVATDRIMTTGGSYGGYLSLLL